MPEDTALTVGDTVCLNSGGDLMTVVSIDQESVTCAWLVKGAVKSYTSRSKRSKNQMDSLRRSPSISGKSCPVIPAREKPKDVVTCMTTLATLGMNSVWLTVCRPV